MMTRTKYGDRRACALCGSDIEWHGKRFRRSGTLPDMMSGGWTDRGGSHFCDSSGAARWDEDGIPVPFPHVLHRPTKD